MVVEPASLCWITGRMVEARDGLTWAEEFARFPALSTVVRDDGAGWAKGWGSNGPAVAPPTCRSSATRSTSSIHPAKEDVL
jgi:hypothetical protein